MARVLAGVLIAPLIALSAVCPQAHAQAAAGTSDTARPAPSAMPSPPPSGAVNAPGGGLRASDPRSVATAFEQASRLHREGRSADALKAIDLALKTSPRDPQLRFLYGVIVSEQGRADDAADVFQQLTEDFPELPEPYNNLAVLRAAKGDLDGARRALEAAVQALPNYTLGHENLGDVYLRMAARAWERAGKSERGGETARAKLAMARDMLSKLPQPAPPRARGESAPSGASPASGAPSSATPAAASPSSPSPAPAPETPKK